MVAQMKVPRRFLVGWVCPWEGPKLPSLLPRPRVHKAAPTIGADDVWILAAAFSSKIQKKLDKDARAIGSHGSNTSMHLIIHHHNILFPV